MVLFTIIILLIQETSLISLSLKKKGGVGNITVAKIDQELGYSRIDVI